MMTDQCEQITTFKNILNDLNNLHYPSGPIYRNIQKYQALAYLNEDEIKAIYHLSESHAPNFRNKAAARYETSLLNSKGNGNCPLNKSHFNFQCTSINVNEKVKSMLKNLSEMPKEWTIIQLTAQYNVDESLSNDPEKHYSNPIHISLLHCGRDQPEPFCLTVDSPRSTINNEIIEVCQEMYSIRNDSKNILTGLKFCSTSEGTYKSRKDKENYIKNRDQINARLKNVVKEIEIHWLREWRCLLIGKCVDETTDNIIALKIKEFFENKYPNINLSNKNQLLLKYLVKGSSYLKLKDISRAIKFCFQNEINFSKQFQSELTDAIRKEDLLLIGRGLRHPIILIIDEKLDFLPWEMVDVLKGHPVSRMPSLHFTYALFKEHESSIVNGVKVVMNPKLGKYIINPNLDLKKMEVRLKTFIDYWVPEWTGLLGTKPTESEFEEILKTCNIFCYGGHNSGLQYFSGEKTENLKINALVLLFGCGSVALTSVSPQIEMTGSQNMYLAASCPCIVGMLWEVTDLDTDILTTEFLSCLISSNAPTHWKYVDRKQWSKCEGLSFQDKSNSPPPISCTAYAVKDHEPEVLRAVWKAKSAIEHYMLQAACIVRGLPTRIN